jgi:hypothetical protein
MSSELERRLEGMLGTAPEPDAGAGEEALGRALAALQPATPRRRGRRAAVVVFAVVAVLLALAAGSLAAAGTLHVTFGAKQHRLPATIPLSLPKGANGIAAIVDGKLSVVTKSGFRLQGLPVSSAALSPHALYVAAGIGHSLVALRPNGTQAWSHYVDGKVVDIAWAPDGLRIAYIVKSTHGYRWRLHVIWGNGTHSQVMDRGVSPTVPSWRADSLAFAYGVARGPGGPLLVRDLAHGTLRPIRLQPPQGGVARLAFAPTGTELLVNEARRTQLIGKHRETLWKGATHGIGWLDGQPAIAAAIPGLPRRGIDAFATHGRLLAVAVPGRGGTVRILAGPVGHLRTVLQVPTKTHCHDESLGHTFCPAIGEDGVQLG